MHVTDIEVILNRTRDNPIKFFLYWCALPLIRISIKAGLSATWVSIMSMLFALVATSLSFIGQIGSVVALWTFSLLLDFADGPVARLTNTVEKTARKTDHHLDLAKLALLVGSICVLHDQSLIWGLALVSISAFYIFTILNQRLALIRKIHPKSLPKDDAPREATRGSIGRGRISRILKTSILSIDGHWLLYLIIALIHQDIAATVLVLLFSVSVLWGIRIYIRLGAFPRL